METVTAAYVPTDEDFRLKSNAGEIGIDTNFASQNFWKDVLIRFFKKKSAVIGLIFIVLITVMVIIGPGMTPYTYSEQNLSQKNLAPRVASLEKLGIFDGSESISTTSGSKKMNYYVEKGLDNVYYWFGSDNFGRDIWTRTWSGAKVSLIIAVAAALIDMIIGMSYGLISGYFGGKVDLIMMRIVDIIYSLPDMLIIILLSVVFNETLKPLITGTVLEKLGTNMISMFIVFGLLYWVSMARLIRGQILSIKNNEYVLAARCIGTKNARILRRHILPNCLSVIIITTALQVPSAIFTESYLSFLGLGVSAPLTSLGSLANDARAGMQSYPLRLVIPAIAICLIVLALNLLGDGLRDAFDSKLN